MDEWWMKTVWLDQWKRLRSWKKKLFIKIEKEKQASRTKVKAGGASLNSLLFLWLQLHVSQWSPMDCSQSHWTWPEEMVTEKTRSTRKYFKDKLKRVYIFNITNLCNLRLLPRKEKHSYLWLHFRKYIFPFLYNRLVTGKLTSHVIS